MVGTHPLGEHILAAHLGAVIHVEGFLEAHEAALLPLPLVNFFFCVGGDRLRAHPEIARGRTGRGHINALGHGRGCFDNGLDTVPVDRLQVDRPPQHGRLLVPVTFFLVVLVARRPDIGAVGDRVVIEGGQEFRTRGVWTGQGGVARTQNGGRGPPTGRGGRLEHTGHIAFVGGDLVAREGAARVDRAVQVGDAHHARIAAGVQSQQIQAIRRLVVDVETGKTIERPDHTTTGVDDGAHHLHQAAGDVGFGHLQSVCGRVVVDDGFFASCSNGGQFIVALGLGDGAVFKAFGDIQLAVGAQAAADLQQR